MSAALLVTFLAGVVCGLDVGYVLARFQVRALRMLHARIWGHRAKAADLDRVCPEIRDEQTEQEEQAKARSDLHALRRAVNERIANLKTFGLKGVELGSLADHYCADVSRLLDALTEQERHVVTLPLDPGLAHCTCGAVFLVNVTSMDQVRCPKQQRLTDPV